MKQINEHIRQGSFRQFYLLYGEERYLCRQFRDKLRKALCQEGDTMNTHFFEGSGLNVEEIIDLAETLPFLADRRVIFITDSGLFKSGGEKMAEYLANPGETCFFVFTESEVDKRSKLYKTVQSKGYAAEFPVQNEAVLKRWIVATLAREGKKITESTVQLFLEKTGTDMDNIQTELEKLICYCLDREIITTQDVESICAVKINDRIFDMINAIAAGKQKQALNLYYDLCALKVAPMRILVLIARQCNQLLQVKELKSKGYDNRTIASKMSVAPFIVNKALSQAAKFKSSTLRKAVEKCVEAEESIKTGRMNDRMSVEILILSVL